MNSHQEEQCCFRVDQRLSINSELCTVKFIGYIPNWPSELAIGIEWDHILKGKNNGVLKDLQIFKSNYYIVTSDSEIKTGCSFIKYKKLVSSSSAYNVKVGIDFYSALIDKYTEKTQLDTSNIKFGNKTVLNYGFDKLIEINSNFKKLPTISLNNELVSNVDNIKTLSNQDLQSLLLPNLNILDLSNNLFSSLDQIIDILSLTPNLPTLDLSGNRFVLFPSNGNLKHKITTVINLTLSNNLLFFGNLLFILNNFTGLNLLNLSENYISVNFLSNLIKPDINPFSNIKSLNLSNNNINQLPWFLFKAFPNLSILNLSNNKIILSAPNSGNKDIDINNVDIYNSLVDLNLSSNLISEWFELDIINWFFNNLNHLKINDNPLTINFKQNFLIKNKIMNNKDFEIEKKFIDEIFINIIFRFDSNLKKLNGSDININEKKNADYYFISKFKQLYNDHIKRNTKFNDNYIFSDFGLKRWDFLIDEYNLYPYLSEYKNVQFKNKAINNFNIENNENTLTKDLIQLRIKFHLNDKIYKINNFQIFTNITNILKFKSLILKKFNLINILQYYEIKIFYWIGNKFYEIESNESLKSINDYNFKNGDIIEVFTNFIY
ncbi:Pac2p ASCRUDRAFT_5500 [Ascoidea rubescens DSM 1968]|uniref:CAP-Gly domain-containing protein n=1 Tax=Ascoidea rubescens DSM 1968 TaxID=1344418 RepID=A0A1D2VPJ0_9ASCO|nr:hypothetical protein ASCRUDRAFT_5500 [Ascoidea rubescens DSM 1968]ODV63528.1 hypothetical protein ASCRUDRAFT_5500 [Ascoidea rubescens DSM 1968]